MNNQMRRLPRSCNLAKENKNAVPRVPSKDILKPTTRRAFADQKNTRVITNKAVVRKVEPAVHREIPIIHPEVRGIEREFSAVDFADDVYQYLLAREASFTPPRDFMEGKTVTPKMRGILIDWLVQVHVRFHFCPETLHLAVHLVDCSIGQIKIEKAELQLVGVASMFVASKFEEMYVPDISDFEFIADNSFVKRDLLKMELKVLQASGMQLAKPYSIAFLRRLSKEMALNARQHAMAKYLGEIALLDAGMCHFLPSQTAAISIHVATRLVGVEIDAKKMLETINWSMEGLQAGARVLAQTTLGLQNQERLQAVQKKYSVAQFYSVGELTDDGIRALESF